MKPCRSWLCVALVEPQRILVFLVEADRALGAEDLIGVAHLAAGRDAADVERAHGAVGKAAHDLGLIVIGDGHRPAATACRVNGLDVGDQASVIGPASARVALMM